MIFLLKKRLKNLKKTSRKVTFWMHFNIKSNKKFRLYLNTMHLTLKPTNGLRTYIRLDETNTY